MDNTQEEWRLPDLIKSIESEIIDQYLNDDIDRPWIIGFSGGKDSTMLLQIVWYALSRIPKDLLKRSVHIVCNDTLVENPMATNLVDSTLELIQNTINKNALPFYVKKTMPVLKDSFWVKLVGRGYAAPSNHFRWCTQRLKITPTTDYILDTVGNNGSAIVLIGTRKDESAQRAKTIEKYTDNNTRLQKHTIPNIFVFSPIKEVRTEEVWEYLASVPPPWDRNNHKLITLYRNASDGDCPLVIDTYTPSCGKSRFGCWVCTVVSKDKSINSLIDRGEEWLEPLADIREYLLEIRAGREKYRYTERRKEAKKKGFLGPYLPETRYKILEKILKTQKEIGNKTRLISKEELLLIQQEWEIDNITEYNAISLYQDIFNDNSSEIRFLESLGDVPIIRKKRPRRKKLTKLDEKLLG